MLIGMRQKFKSAVIEDGTGINYVDVGTMILY